MRVKIDLDDTLYKQLVERAEADLRPLDLEILYFLTLALANGTQREDNNAG